MNKNYILKKQSITDDKDINEFKTRLGVVGYRNYHNYDHIKKELDYFALKRKIDIIVSGGCTGVDTMGEKWAHENNIPVKILLPVKSLGKRSYALRDQEIVNHSTHLIAFPSKKGKGTQLTIAMARRKEGMKIKVIEID